MQLDDIDLKILKHLQQEGKMTNVALAKKINISPPPTLERVKKLERSGVIKKYVALVEPASVGIGMHTFVEVKLIRHSKEAVSGFFEAIGNLQEIMECHHVTGEADFLLKIAVKDISAFEDLVLHELTALPHVGNLKTMVVLSTVKNETAYNLEGVNNEE
ncbi:MAG: Lrp/AsnC family transcriptional regulator [Spirochaetaceae bacterium]|nr:Lrp/AsnC family transcriptional regulator [Spirochaetaceae bacterium]